MKVCRIDHGARTTNRDDQIASAFELVPICLGNGVYSGRPLLTQLSAMQGDWGGQVTKQGLQ